MIAGLSKHAFVRSPRLVMRFQLPLLFSHFICIITALKGPEQAPSFNPDGKGPVDRTRHVFRDYEQRVGTTYNKYIPASSAKQVRIMQWNTHMLLDLAEKTSKVDDFIEDIKTVDPDILVMEEIPLKTEERMEQFEQRLMSLGYLHQAVRYSREEGAQLGIMIASRYPIPSVQYFELGFKRILIDASIKLGDFDYIHVLGTHLEVTDAVTRRDQAAFIADYLFKSGNFRGNFVLVGDFNGPYTGIEIEPLKDANHKEAFRSLGWAHPEYTCWSGAEIDFMFVGEETEKKLLGAYVFHSPTSDHLPLLLDLRRDAEKNSVDSELPQYDTSTDVKWLLMVVAILVIVYALAIKFIPRSAWNNAYRTLRNFESM